jgi:hypothetical protein
VKADIQNFGFGVKHILSFKCRRGPESSAFNSNRIMTLEKLDESVHINCAWEIIGNGTKNSAKQNLGFHKVKPNKPWFDDKNSKLID